MYNCKNDEPSYDKLH